MQGTLPPNDGTVRSTVAAVLQSTLAPLINSTITPEPAINECRYTNIRDDFYYPWVTISCILVLAFYHILVMRYRMADQNSIFQNTAWLWSRNMMEARPNDKKQPVTAIQTMRCSLQGIQSYSGLAASVSIYCLLVEEPERHRRVVYMYVSIMTMISVYFFFEQQRLLYHIAYLCIRRPIEEKEWRPKIGEVVRRIIEGEDAATESAAASAAVRALEDFNERKRQQHHSHHHSFGRKSEGSSPCPTPSSPSSTPTLAAKTEKGSHFPTSSSSSNLAGVEHHRTLTPSLHSAGASFANAASFAAEAIHDHLPTNIPSLVKGPPKTVVDPTRAGTLDQEQGALALWEYINDGSPAPYLDRECTVSELLNIETFMPIEFEAERIASLLNLAFSFFSFGQRFFFMSLPVMAGLAGVPTMIAASLCLLVFHIFYYDGLFWERDRGGLSRICADWVDERMPCKRSEDKDTVEKAKTKKHREPAEVLDTSFAS